MAAREPGAGGRAASRWRLPAWAVLVAATAMACQGLFGGSSDAPQDTADAPPRAVPAQARLHRLTADGYRASTVALLGVAVTEPLPVDLRLHGFTSMGASELSIAPADLELYEAAAWQVATDALPDAATRDALLGCALADVEPAESCVGPWAADLAHRAWRRPLDQDDLDLLLDVYGTADEIAGDETIAARAVVATVLSSPWFLFRVEVGVPTQDRAVRALTDHEVASRLSAFLTGAPPDRALMADADAGRLDDEALRGHVRRLLASPEAELRLAGFFTELLDLQRLQTVDKDPDLYPTFTPALRAAMAHELQALFTDVVLTQDADVRTVLTSDRAWVTPALAAHYGMDSVSEPGWVSLPAEQERGGLLGRAGFLALESHAAATSPTHRGLFVQTRLLCGTVSPPPEGIETTLPAVDPDNPMTTRERLTQHAEDPACRGCHLQMDPFGLALEHYDAVGAFRTQDEGLDIDATASVGGFDVDGAAQLGAAVGEDPRLTACLVRQLYRHALGQHESEGEQQALDQLSQVLVERDHRLLALVEDLVLHPAFRQASPPVDEACDVEGAVRECSTPCGTGERRCEDGRWRDCSALPPQPEVCNGIDDDCDGVVDEAVRTCEARLGAGIQTCDAGEWAACSGPAPRPETCNGMDDDGDGLVDEDLSVDIAQIDDELLYQAHADCDLSEDASSGTCRAAAHRTCAARDCSVTGFGMVALGEESVSLACLDEEQAVIRHTTYSTLSGAFEYCRADTHRWGTHCNAAINRWCRSQGLRTGFGPIENSGDSAVVVCTPQATLQSLTYTQLAPYSAPDGAECDGVQARLGPACDVAIHQLCLARGYSTGFGPLENHNDDLQVACLGDGGGG